MEYLLDFDEGHGFARPVNNMATLMATETFLRSKDLDGRYQEGGTPEVVTRRADHRRSQNRGAGKVGGCEHRRRTRVGLINMQPGTFKLQAKLEMGSRQIPLIWGFDHHCAGGPHLAVKRATWICPRIGTQVTTWEVLTRRYRRISLRSS